MRVLKTPGRYFHALCRKTFSFVLAGGRGSRLEDLTKLRAKPATPFGGKYRIIDFTLSNCINSGLHRIAVLTQYNALGLIAHIQRTWGHYTGSLGEFIAVVPAEQRKTNKWYRGTADAIYQNLHIIKKNGVEYVLILAGDHVYNMDYLKLLEEHADTNADITISCIKASKKEASKFGIVGLDSSKRKVKKFLEKPNNISESMLYDENNVLVSMGIYCFKANILKELLHQDATDENSKHDFGFDILPKAIQNYNVHAHHFSDYNMQSDFWRDVGTVDSYYDASMELIAPIPKLNLYDESWPIWTFQEHRPPAKIAIGADGNLATVRDSLLSAGVIVSGAEITSSILCYNNRILSKSEINQSILLPDVEVGKNCRIHHAIIDNECQIPDRTIIGEDPELDAKRFLVTKEGVVVVTKERLQNKVLDQFELETEDNLLSL